MLADEIVKYGDEVLKTPTEEVTVIDDELRKLVEHMVDVMYEARGVGLAANQVGVAKRFFVYDVGDGANVLFNPRILRRSGSDIAVEGCLSIPGLQGEVQRSRVVTVAGLDINGEPVKIRAEGLLARAFQHEIDHLDGHLFIEKADPDTLSWGNSDDDDDEIEE